MSVFNVNIRPALNGWVVRCERNGKSEEWIFKTWEELCDWLRIQQESGK